MDTEKTPRFGLPSSVIQPRELTDDLRVFKLGRSTGWTEGQYDDLLAAHLEVMDENGNKYIEDTKEHSVIGLKGEPFSIDGDSGAFVFDRALALVGMVFSGHSSRKRRYITSCDDLFRDIMEITGALDIRVPIQ